LIREQEQEEMWGREGGKEEGREGGEGAALKLSNQ